MATYRKLLRNANGDAIIPIINRDLLKAKILSSSIPTGTYNITDKGIVYGIGEFQCGSDTSDTYAYFSISGNSGGYVAPRAYQYQAYVKGQAHIFAMVDAGDRISIGRYLSGSGSWSDRGFLVFLPCNW